MDTKPTENRLFWVDAARVFAIIAITLNHALNRTFNMHDTALEFQTIPFGLTVFKSLVQIFSRIGVPVFLMITGALLLGRDYSDEATLKKFYKRNWISLFITAEVWYFIIFIYKSLAPNSILRTKGVAAALLQLICNQLFINQDSFSSMWYMAMILCVYLLIPFISLGVKNIKSKYIMIPVLIAFLSGFLFPNINSCISLATSGKISNLIDFGLSVTNLFSLYVIYIYLGYRISLGALDDLPGFVLVPGLIVSFLGTSGYQLWAFSRPVNYIVTYNSAGILIVSALLFECYRRYGSKLQFAKRPVELLSEISFGIYFVHICIMEGIQVFLPTKVGYIPYFLILEIVSFGLSILLIQIIRKSKFLGRILFRI